METEKILPILRKSVESACVDQPERKSFQVIDGQFVFTIIGNVENRGELCKLMGVPASATQEITDEVLICRWPSHADEIFGFDGILAQRLPGYEMRTAQLYAGRLFQRGIEMGEPVVLEAGTGTGKSLIYLLIARAMGKRVIVSTSNKALQMQLYDKDAPFVANLFPSKIVLVQGKSNYVCRYRVEGDDENKKAIDLGEDLNQWYANTTTGNTQEIRFETDWKQLSKITVNDSCVGKACDHYHRCFYYEARAERQDAHIIICNHMLLAMHQLYPTAQILPRADVIVVDEAHQLAQYVSNALGVEFNIESIQRQIDTLQEWNTAPANIDRAFWRLQEGMNKRTFNIKDEEIAIKHEDVINTGLELADMLTEGAELIWKSDTMAGSAQHIRQSNIAKRIRSVADNLRFVCKETPKGNVRWLTKKTQTISNVPFDVAAFVGSIAGFRESPTVEIDHTRCARCFRTLSAELVYLLNGVPFGPTCIGYMDPFGDSEQVNLQEWLKREHPPVSETKHQKTAIMFTSATLGTPDLAPFMRDHGIAHALTMQVESPFDYENNSLLYVPANDAPSPKSAEYLDFMVEQMSNLVHASKGGVFLLFTSNKALRHAVENLRIEFVRAGYPVYVQGEGYSKLEIVKRIKEDRNAVLFATKSFFEGVDIQGDALRLVVIDKMPFAAPSPFNTAQNDHLREWARQNLTLNAKDLEWYPFNAKSIPDMIIDLKQGAGRLIRSATDKGVMVILDNRMLTTQYGRSKVLPSLPSSPLVRSMEHVTAFFNPVEPSTPIASLNHLELGKALYAR